MRLRLVPGLLILGLALSCSSFPKTENPGPGQEASYALARRLFYLSMKKTGRDLPWLSDDERATLVHAERSFPGLYEHLMGFYPYSVLFEREDREGTVAPLQTLALRLAGEFLGSISEGPAAGRSAIERTLTGAGFDSRRSGPCPRRLVRMTAPMVRENWGWKELRMEEAHRLATGLGVRLAVIDTGLDPTIKDIRKRVIDYRDFLVGERPFWGKRHFPYDWGGHGTAVASIVAQAAPKAALLVARVYDEASMGQAAGNWWTVNLLEAGIAWAVEHGADIINLSFGVRGDAARMRNLVRRCWEKNIILVTSVGNVLDPSDERAIFYPAAYPWPIAVGGAERQGDLLRVWDRSGGGDYLDVVAPAASIWVEQPSYLDERRAPRRAYGNSLATAMVSGTAALVLSAMDGEERIRLKQVPGALCDKVREIICRTASNSRLGYAGFNPHSGYGLIDPVRAVKDARSLRHH